MADRIDLTDEEWRERAFIMDALRTRLGDLVEAAQEFGAIKERQYYDRRVSLDERDEANLCEHRARQAVADFVAAMHDHFEPAESAAARLDWLVVNDFVPALRRTETGWQFEEATEDYTIVSEGETYNATIDKARTVAR